MTVKYKFKAGILKGPPVPTTPVINEEISTLLESGNACGLEVNQTKLKRWSENRSWRAAKRTLQHSRSGIEGALPIEKLSAESYKERKAGSGQRLTGIGKWWGRKPLVLVRATILGCLLPATDDAEMDVKVFERLMGMDDHGLYERRTRRAQSREEFDGLTYDQKLNGAILAEAYDGPSDSESWAMINGHLGTGAANLWQLVEQLGAMRFGHTPRVGDVFAGGGSIPFEAARIGCEAYASDLNPVAALLNYSNQALLCATPEDKIRIDAAQEQVFAEVDRQITEWGIEHDERGRRADAYLWCVEVLDPETGYCVPLAATWVISVKDRVVAELIPDHANKRYDIQIVTGASDAQMAKAKNGTVVNQHLIPPPTPECPNPPSTEVAKLRDRQNDGKGLIPWEMDQIVPRPEDFYQERLYCVRWIEEVREVVKGKLKVKARRSYESVTDADLQREEKCLQLLMERREEWIEKGYIPDSEIKDGNKTSESTRTRGWTNWSHLFSPRQLLTNGLFSKYANDISKHGELLTLIGLAAEKNAKMCTWHKGGSGKDGASPKVEHVFTGQSISPVYSYAVRAFSNLSGINTAISSINSNKFNINVEDARKNANSNDLWITDPPYADAVAYEEISEFFLAWYEKHIQRLFPEWYADSKRALAIKGKGDDFKRGLMEVYRNLTNHMPDNGVHVVMFTHQDAGVWGDLAMTLWAAGLKVTAAWTVATETTTGLKAGTNSVQGTVLLVLRKRLGDAELVFEDEVLPRMESEVKRQLDNMRSISNLTFTDADLQLGAYAAALRVITEVEIDGLNLEHELMRERKKGEKSRVQEFIEQASRVAANDLIPTGLERDLWRRLEPTERYYLKGLEVERKGEQREGVYTELARAFGVTRHTELFGNSAANHVRMSTPTELGGRSPAGLSGGTLRLALRATGMVSRGEKVDAVVGWLVNEMPNFHTEQARLVTLLRYVALMSQTGSEHWEADAKSALILAGAIESRRL